MTVANFQIWVATFVVSACAGSSSASGQPAYAPKHGHRCGLRVSDRHHSVCDARRAAH
jgi:hypothetical protein